MRVLVVGSGINGVVHHLGARPRGPRGGALRAGADPQSARLLDRPHRLIRFTYGAMTGYARMVQDAYAAWDRLFADLGRSHYRPTGTLAVAREDGGWVADSIRCLADLGVAFERWTPRDLARRLPFLDFAGARFALFSPSGGVLFAERILRDLARHLTARGVALHCHTAVRHVDPANAAIVTADGREDRGDALVVAAGAWAPQLLPALAGRVTPSRQVAVYLEQPEDRLPTWRAAPMLLDQIEATAGGFYAVPPVDGTALKVGDHGFSLRGHPDREHEPAPAEVATILALAAARLRDFERYRVSVAKTCFYAVTEDQRFLIQRCEAAWILAGFSGHGFKFAAVIGERIAAALAGEQSAEDLGAWAAGRLLRTVAGERCCQAAGSAISPSEGFAA